MLELSTKHAYQLNTRITKQNGKKANTTHPPPGSQMSWVRQSNALNTPAVTTTYTSTIDIHTVLKAMQLHGEQERLGSVVSSDRYCINYNIRHNIDIYVDTP